MMTTAERVVPFFDYSYVFKAHETEFVSIFRDVGRRGAFILQHDLSLCERSIATFLGANHALGVGNATDGLTIALRAAGLAPGDEVILSSHTMIATASAVHFAGGTPVPVECGADHLIDPAAVEAAITRQTRAILPTQLNGRTCNMDALRAVADKHGLMIIEDAAQALGSRFKGRCAGTFGVAGAISFYPAKVLGCFGDGGAVISNCEGVYNRAFQLRDHGRNHDGEIVSWGLNSRLDNLQAAILNYGLARYDRVMARRREIAALYTNMLEHVSEVVLPPAPDSDRDHFDVYQNYEIEAERRDELKEYLKQRGIGTLVQWGGQAVHRLRTLGFTQSLPYTERLFTRMLMLPMNMALSDGDVDYVCEHVRRFYGR